jgi:hypothetical protein
MTAETRRATMTDEEVAAAWAALEPAVGDCFLLADEKHPTVIIVDMVNGNEITGYVSYALLPDDGASDKEHDNLVKVGIGWVWQQTIGAGGWNDPHCYIPLHKATLGAVEFRALLEGVMKIEERRAWTESAAPEASLTTAGLR